MIVTLGLLVWVPFLYVAIRRGRGSDWFAFAAFLLYELVILPWASFQPDGAGDTVLGMVVVFTMMMAVGLLLFAVFDRRGPKNAVVSGVPFPAPPHSNPYMR